MSGPSLRYKPPQRKTRARRKNGGAHAAHLPRCAAHSGTAQAPGSAALRTSPGSQHRLKNIPDNIHNAVQHTVFVPRLPRAGVSPRSPVAPPMPMILPLPVPGLTRHPGSGPAAGEANEAASRRLRGYRAREQSALPPHPAPPTTAEASGPPHAPSRAQWWNMPCPCAPAPPTRRAFAPASMCAAMPGA